MEKITINSDDKLTSIISRLITVVKDITENFQKLESAAGLDNTSEDTFTYVCNVLIGLGGVRELLEDARIARRADLVISKEKEKEEEIEKEERKKEEQTTQNMEEFVGIKAEMAVLHDRITRLEECFVCDGKILRGIAARIGEIETKHMQLIDNLYKRGFRHGSPGP